jgi:hypothetical protein
MERIQERTGMLKRIVTVLRRLSSDKSNATRKSKRGASGRDWEFNNVDEDFLLLDSGGAWCGSLPPQYRPSTNINRKLYQCVAPIALMASVERSKEGTFDGTFPSINLVSNSHPSCFELC